MRAIPASLTFMQFGLSFCTQWSDSKRLPTAMALDLYEVRT